MMCMNEFLIVKSLILLTCLSLALYQDIKIQKIKNIVTFPIALTGFAVNFLQWGPVGTLVSLKGWLVPVAVLIVFYYINVMGAGDIKLFAAIGAVMGLRFAMYSFVYSVFAGGVIAVMLLIFRKQFKEKMRRVFDYLKYTLFTGQLSIYSRKGDISSKFIFSTAIVPGTLYQLYLYLQGAVS